MLQLRNNNVIVVLKRWTSGLADEFLVYHAGGASE